jgi:hypothetical protein
MSDTEEKQRERRIRFNGRVQFKTIRHVSEFSEEEIGAGWYRKKDFVRMSEDVSKIANLVSKGTESHNGEELCIRGLEHLVEEDVADYRAEKMIASIDAVLDEQDEQRDEDVFDPDIIAQMYAEIVSPLLREAYLVGLRDAQEAAAAAEQIPDVVPPDVTVPRSKSVKSDSTSVTYDTSPPMEGEDVLNSSSDITGVVDNSNPPKVSKKRILRGLATENSPFVRRRDGTIVFRNRNLALAKAELKKKRKDCVRDSLFKYLDDMDDSQEPVEARFLRK